MSGCPNKLAGYRWLACATWALVFAAVGPALAQGPTPPDAIIETHGAVNIGGSPLRYTVRTGALPLYADDTGELMARLFIIAYTADRGTPRQARPITFVWNGGPGANSSQAHLMGFGPKGFQTPATYPQWQSSPPQQIVDRPETWLASTDLVFVDPMGTGYSRATSQKYRELLYTTRGDIEAVAEGIRLYLTRFDAWDAPIFLAGESYGTTRAMGVAQALERRRTRVAGVVLISGSYDVGQSMPPTLEVALRVPLYTTAAYYHRRLAPELLSQGRAELVRQVVDWAKTQYAPALETPGKLGPAARAKLLVQLERYTAIPQRFVDGKTLQIGEGVFADELLRDQGLELGHYDLRLTGPRRKEDTLWLPTSDPSILPMLDLMQGTSVPALRYFRDTLQYRSDLLYRGPFGEEFHPQPLISVTGRPEGPFDDWMAIMWDRAPAQPAQEEHANTPSGHPKGSPAPGRSQSKGEHPGSAPATPVSPPLRQAMLLDRQLKVFNVTGMYDSSCAAKDEEVARSEPDIRRRVRNGCYEAGHMVYTDIEVRRQLQRDFARFVEDARAPAPAARAPSAAPAGVTTH